jgi:molybdopterin adenylyltransferase
VKLRFGVLTVSDRSARGERIDASGPALTQMITAQGWEVARKQIVPDERKLIQATLLKWVDGDALDVIVTTGGTGFAPRDVTPEATVAVLEREAPGLATAIRAANGIESPQAMLSRGVAGTRGAVLILNVPGSPKAAVESLGAVLTVLEHAVDLLRNGPGAEAGHARAVV